MGFIDGEVSVINSSISKKTKSVTTKMKRCFSFGDSPVDGKIKHTKADCITLLIRNISCNLQRIDIEKHLEDTLTGLYDSSHVPIENRIIGEHRRKESNLGYFFLTVKHWMYLKQVKKIINENSGMQFFARYSKRVEVNIAKQQVWSRPQPQIAS